MEYIPRGVCSRLIKVDVDDNKIQNLSVDATEIFKASAASSRAWPWTKLLNVFKASVVVRKPLPAQTSLLTH